MTSGVLVVPAVVLGALATAGVARTVVDTSLTSVTRAKRRARGEGGEAGRAKDDRRASVLTRMVAMSSSGLLGDVAGMLSPYAAMLDPSGTKWDRIRLAQAGLSGYLTETEVLRARAWIGLITGVGIGVIYHSNGLLALLFALVGFVLGVRLPSFLVAAVAEQRQRQCLKDLPEMIDMIALASRAGMSFDAALAAYCSRFDTPLGREFTTALDVWSVGAVTREDALLTIGETLDVDAVTRFVAAVVQALRLGSPLARVLEAQAEDARKSQRLAVEELIAKAPVKMFVPVGALILPAMLILMLGPMMLQLLAGMGSF